MFRFLFMILTVFVSLLWPLAAQASAFGDQVADMAEVKAVRIGASSDHCRGCDEGIDVQHDGTFKPGTHRHQFG